MRPRAGHAEAPRDGARLLRLPQIPARSRGGTRLTRFTRPCQQSLDSFEGREWCPRNLPRDAAGGGGAGRCARGASDSGGQVKKCTAPRMIQGTMPTTAAPSPDPPGKRASWGGRGEGHNAQMGEADQAEAARGCQADGHTDVTPREWGSFGRSAGAGGKSASPTFEKGETEPDVPGPPPW